MIYETTVHLEAGRGPAQLFTVDADNERQARSMGLHQFFNHGGRADYIKKTTVHKPIQVAA